MATRKENGKRKETLAQAIRHDFRSGALVPGEMLPPVRVLASRYGLSRRVAHDELQKLAAEGWLRTVPRVGIFVREESQEYPRFLDHAIVVLTSTDPTQANQNQNQSGWADHVSYGALREIHARGLHSVVLHPKRLCGELIERLALDQPYGVIIPEIQPASMQKYGELLRAKGVAVVMFGDDQLLAEFDRVSSDHIQGAYVLTRWLLDQGLRQVHPSWTDESPTAYWRHQRRQGYERAMKEAGLRPLADINVGASDTSSIAAALNPHLHGTNPLQAILTPSDGSVSDYAVACRSLGTEPNRDVLICGYDNYWEDLINLGHHEPRPAATVDKRNDAIGAEGVRLLLEKVEAGRRDSGGGPGAAAPTHRTIAPRLVVTTP